MKKVPIYKRINELLGTNYKSYKEIDWISVSMYEYLTEDFIEEFKNKVDWEYISCYQILSENFIEKFKNYVSWYYISIHQILSESFIEKFKNKVDWYCISVYQKLSEKFMEKYINKLDFSSLQTNQILSENFIEKNLSKVNWEYIIDNQILSKNFLIKYINKIPTEDLKSILLEFEQPFISINDVIKNLSKQNLIFLGLNNESYKKFIIEKSDKFYKLYQKTKERGWFFGYIVKDHNKYRLISNERNNKSIQLYNINYKKVYKVRIWWKDFDSLTIVSKFTIIRRIKGL